MKPVIQPCSTTRRTLLKSFTVLPLAGIALSSRAQNAATDQLAQLESGIHGRIGISALDSATGRTLLHRADERFPLCSTFKLMLAGAVLKDSIQHPDLMSKRLHIQKRDLVHNSPITEKHVRDGMRIDALCEAAIQHSDNAAANLLTKELGGPEAVTAFARTIGDDKFRVDRYETMMSASLPGDVRDTTTPAAMMHSIKQLTSGDALPQTQRDQMTAWLRGTVTAPNRIRAGVPSDWQVAHKTGTGDYGTTNDVAALYPPNRAPLFLAIYLTQDDKNADVRDDLLAAATRIVVATLA